MYKDKKLNLLAIFQQIFMIFSRKDLFYLKEVYIYIYYIYGITEKNNPLIKLFLWTRIIQKNDLKRIFWDVIFIEVS